MKECGIFHGGLFGGSVWVVMTSKEKKVLEEARAWFEALLGMNELENYEHPLFIAVADWLNERGEALDSIEEWIPDSLVKSLPPSMIESLRVSMEVEKSKLLLTRVPVPSLAAQFEANILPEGAYLGEPKVPQMELPKDLESVPAPANDTPTVPNILRIEELLIDMKRET